MPLDSTHRQEAAVLRSIGDVFAQVARRFTPSPFVFAILLTFVVWAAGVGLTDSGPFDMVVYWYEGFWNLLTFSMQVVIILLSGYVLATSPQARRLVEHLATLPASSGQAILLIAGVTIVTGWLNWGLGLVTGAVMAVAVSESAGRRGIPIHYPLAAAAGYMGILIFGSGLSSSAPLLVNTEDHFLFEEIGLVPVAETILTPYNLITTAAFLLVIPFVLRAMHPSEEECRPISAEAVRAFREDSSGAQEEEKLLAARLEESRWLSYPVALTGMGFVGWFFFTRGLALDLNIVNFTLIMVGMALYGTPAAYVRAMQRAVGASTGIILQFPFYAGMMGMMTLSGLVGVFANAIISVSTPTTFPLASMFSAGLVNFFVPSAGGQWAVQGPILMEAARALDVSVGQTIVAFAYGDQLTNMIQPFWAIPLLGTTDLEARDLLGYTAVAMLVAAVIFGAGVSLLPLVTG
ncbi:MAG: short-chain fatty acid transporter [Longimicrobiales bacterium]